MIVVSVVIEHKKPQEGKVKDLHVVRPRYGFYSLPVGQELDMVSK